MFDVYTLGYHADYHAEEAARDYRNARYEQSWLVAKVGTGLEALFTGLANWSNGMKRQTDSMELQPARISQTMTRR